MAPGYGTAVHPRQCAHEKRLQRINVVSLWSPPRATRRVDHGGHPRLQQAVHRSGTESTRRCSQLLQFAMGHVRSRELAEPSVRFACLRQRGHDVRFKGLRQDVLCDWTRRAEACMEQNVNIGDGSCQMADNLAELRAREDEISREWQSLVDALNTVAGARAEQGDLQAFRVMQQQAMRVGMRRVELRIRMAQLEGPRPS